VVSLLAKKHGMQRQVQEQLQQAKHAASVHSQTKADGNGSVRARNDLVLSAYAHTSARRLLCVACPRAEQYKHDESMIVRRAELMERSLAAYQSKLEEVKQAEREGEAELAALEVPMQAQIREMNAQVSTTSERVTELVGCLSSAAPHRPDFSPRAPLLCCYVLPCSTV
jgi:hypothetical protein